MIESREVHFDYLVELPTGLWQIGQQKLKLRTMALAQGHVTAGGNFVVHRVLKVVGHEVDPSDWSLPPEPEDERRVSRVSV
jgi:hypothetical protein